MTTATIVVYTVISIALITAWAVLIREALRDRRRGL